MSPVIEVDDSKCVNCHMCISVYPVKFCIDGSGDKVRINHDLCIGCGACIAACSHQARHGVDDSDRFFEALKRGDPMVAIVAPAAAARFPGKGRRLNGWLKSQGIKAVYDVAFGAELTVHSYLRHLAENHPRMIIAQPCPVIVSYIEIFQPALIPHLAPCDSPMLHTMRMLREFHPEHRDAAIAVISPCVAKRREFDETGLGDYNVTLERLAARMEADGQKLDDFPEAEFDSPPAERAVLFSSPGGLKRTVERDAPKLSPGIRKIEGRGIYDYFRELPESLRAGANPLLLDCLNCEKGCNGGTGTGSMAVPVDILERAVEERREEQARELAGRGFLKADPARRIGGLIRKRWKPGLYTRAYTDRSATFALRIPARRELEKIYADMRKEREEDYLNCAACG